LSLVDFLFITFLDTLQLKLERGVNIKLQSNIPIGCGMGSSAATILSVLRGVSKFFDMELMPEKYYNIPGLYTKLQNNCPLGNIRPKETDLMALLESGELDYLFIYRSICEQQKMPFVVLPDEINLKSAAQKKFYSQASVRISGKKPGEYMTKTGKPMVYGITVCKKAPNREAALLFVEFLIGPEGRKIMKENGQPSLRPLRISGRTRQLPDALKQLVQYMDP